MQLAPTLKLWLWALALGTVAAGCGTTKWSDSPRTATEQLLISDAVDRAISEIDFSSLADKHVYLDTRFIITAIDQNYIISTLRQHMLASGCIMHDKAEDATFIVEVRLGSVGTNRQDLLFGMPSTTVPTVGLLPTGAATIPEIALMKRTNQQGVCKIAVFAYSRISGRPVWQSGNRQVASRAKDIWVMGAGPFQRGTIYSGTAFAGEQFSMPLVRDDPPDEENDGSGLEFEKIFDAETPQVAKQPSGDQVNNASYNGPAPKSDAKPAANNSPAPASGDAKPAASGDSKPAAPQGSLHAAATAAGRGAAHGPASGRSTGQPGLATRPAADGQSGHDDRRRHPDIQPGSRPVGQAEADGYGDHVG